MKLRLIRIGLMLVGNAVGLILAAALLDDMSLDGVAFVVAVAIFTVATIVLDPLIARVADRYVEALSGVSSLIATAISLVVTSWISDGLSISGAVAWILATLIVWLTAAVLGLVLTRIFIKANT